ncbi:MAG: EAL domain-containing protein [Gammaproteobacteria bacterium]|nr:EAL domain-containing protein [Gammaproteobacteria bacterium]
MPIPISLHALTALPDRSACMVEAGRLVAEARQRATTLAVLWLDLDRFQSINRAFGHAGGDQVIDQVARRIEAHRNPATVLCHVGADEFVLLTPGTTRDQAARIAAELMTVVQLPLELGAVQLHPALTIGIAILERDEGAAELLHRADRAKHDAKEQGGNCWVFSGEERVLGRHGTPLEREDLQIENDLHDALDTGGLSLHYQPIINRDGSVEGAEALMRCTVNGRTTRPDELIRVAEKTGLIARLGEWSLVTAAEFARDLCAAGMRTKIAVNVSATQLHATGFSESLAGALLLTNLDPALLELEVTESLVLRLSAEVQSNIDTCTRLGNPLAIDDFGTGESCLAKLKDLPATKLKLDRAFSSVLPADRRAFAVVRAMSQLGRELGMTVVAEGVETPEQLESLWQAEVDAVQGYYFARPMPSDAFVQWLKGRS